MFLLDEFDFCQRSHARKRGGLNAGSGKMLIPVDASGKGRVETPPKKGEATTTVTGSNTPQAKTQISAGCAVLVMSQSVCPVGQTFATAIVNPSAITIKLARKSRRMEVIDRN